MSYIEDAEDSSLSGNYPLLQNTQKLLVEYFNIDLNKLEAEKRQMLEELRKENA